MTVTEVFQLVCAQRGLFCVAVCAVLSWLGWAPGKRWLLRRVPGPFALPFLGHLPAIASKDITFFFLDVARKYGPVAQVWLGARPWVLISDPATVRKLAYKYSARPEDAISFFHLLVDEPREVELAGLLSARGPPWRAGRRAFEASIMHPAKLASHSPAIRRCIDRWMTKLLPYAKSGEALDVRTLLGNLTLAITGEVAYGVDFWCEEGGGEGGSRGGSTAAELVAACRECFECMELTAATSYLGLQVILPALQPLWLWLAKHLPDAAQRRHMRARQKVADVSRRLMEQWQQQVAQKTPDNGAAAAEVLPNGRDGTSNGLSDSKGGASGDGAQGSGISSSSFLAAMMEDRKREVGNTEVELPRMGDIEVIAQGLTFILAGFETTSTTLALIAYLLSTNPGAQEKLRQELAANAGCLDDMEQLGQLPYLDAVVREAQRLYPAGTFLLRDVTSDVGLPDGTVLPSGTYACLSIYNMHMDPAQWPEPERFLPERFLPETKGLLGPTDPNAYIPFGVGPRMCVGYKLATMMMKTILASVLLRFKVELHPRQPLPLRLKTGLTMAPVDGVWVSLSEVK